MKTLLPPAQKRLFPWSGIAVACLAGVANLAAQTPIRYIAQLGDHTMGLNDAGYVLGMSTLSGGPPDAGLIAWIADPTGRMTRVGFYDDLHSYEGIGRRNHPFALNAGGVSVGEADRFDWNYQSGKSVWVADRHGTTLKLGFYDAAHTWPDGGKHSWVVDLNDRNEVIGFSIKPDSRSYTAWLGNSVGRIVRIGLHDAVHTGPNGEQSSLPRAINNGGHVVGFSNYYFGAENERGYTLWLRKRWGPTRLIGFQSGIHRSPFSGHYLSDMSFFTDSGYVGGWSYRYQQIEPTRSNGITSWVTHVDGPNRPVGLYDSAHVGPQGFAQSLIAGLTEDGVSAGTSDQVGAVPPNWFSIDGRSAWLAQPTGQTRRIGLMDAEHSRQGHQWHMVVQLNDAMVIGTAERYDPMTGETESGQGGLSGWVTDTATLQTTKLALVDAGHTRADGLRHSTPLGLSPTRYVWGHGARYLDTRSDGTVPNSTWIYDRHTGTYTNLSQLPGAPALFASNESTIVALDDQGVALGHYGDPGRGVPLRAFIYEPLYGVRNLDQTLGVNVASLGWGRFSTVEYVTTTGYIVGEGGNLQGNGRVYLLRRN